MKSLSKLIVPLVLLLIPAWGVAQAKIGFVQSDRIRSEYDEFKEAESELQLEFRKVQFEFQTMAQRLDSLKQVFETQRLVSSPERRREREQEITALEKQVQDFQANKVGPEGELYRKQLQMETEIIQKVQRAVNKVAIDKGYDYILDSAALLYGKPTHNLTDDVLYELRRLSEEESEK
ncbi:MAG: OmpH family outer membrane protein [Candidatus Marinimicrobia bacterium]|nr:OmpH family outer membrane protein [Candidatus Neomarinimicrobiota bacterium]MDP6594057.1 OmpH family outer membrane protein [Candidatus Neomarinimicrobiota bacterium]MDP6836554.1 OmpH family outer membrane protein [Candidatus Neomarinimicrobiota bacterium]MDP6966980.1 OmpH family outer membrane protein [Candidatus Neomarinimicrobiota bacterium]